jgi:hypothetical protein
MTRECDAVLSICPQETDKKPVIIRRAEHIGMPTEMVSVTQQQGLLSSFVDDTGVSDDQQVLGDFES